MKPLLLDTNVLIKFLQGDEEIGERLFIRLMGILPMCRCLNGYNSIPQAGENFFIFPLAGE